jgi:hypothetical protein
MALCVLCGEGQPNSHCSICLLGFKNEQRRQKYLGSSFFHLYTLVGAGARGGGGHSQKQSFLITVKRSHKIYKYCNAEKSKGVLIYFYKKTPCALEMVTFYELGIGFEQFFLTVRYLRGSSKLLA